MRDRGKGKPAWDKTKRQDGPRKTAPTAGQEKGKEESDKPFWQKRQDAQPASKTKSNSAPKPNKGRRREKDRDWEIIKPEGKVSVKGPVKRKEGPIPRRAEPQPQAPQGKPNFGKKAKGMGTNQEVPKPTFRPEVARADKPQPPPQFVRKDKTKPAPSAKPTEKSKGKPERSSSKPSNPADSTKPTEKSKPGKVAISKRSR
ncbi:hypothetical protein [Verrucomicrobium spinosum]|uniref:hypothetical protein n=1 Tax=Verrucomicrobium spinosum TaxID=2736 RepID=UPI00094663A4|nr:hypothetical protein [Verrucomicrobium spinosum]